MKNFTILFVLVLQITIFPSFRISSASTNLPVGVSGIIRVHQILPIAPRPNRERRRQQWQYYNPKLDSRLNTRLEKTLLDNLEENQISTDTKTNRQHQLTKTICVQVKCAAENRKAIEKRITELKGTITGHNLTQTTIQTLIPLGSLNDLANIPNVHFVRTPNRAVTYSGNYVTEALNDINADNWHNAGIYGQGTRIGVIDVGFNGYNSLLGSDLPATVTASNFVDGETSDQLDSGYPHGTACAEIVHDLAPQASIYLAKISTDIDLQEAVDWLQNSCNVNIISTSLGWYNLTPGDGTGEFSDLVTSAYNAGILWVTAAGNDRLRHWGGDFYDPDGNGTHNFADEQEFNFFGPGNGWAYMIDPGLNYTIFVRWSDWQEVNQDYDLYVYRWDIDGNNGWEKIAWSVNLQNGAAGQTPTEAASFTSYGSPTAYGFALQAFDTTEIVNFEIFIPYAPRFDEILTNRSLPNLADAAKATTVSAINANTYILQEYSAEGPTNGFGGSASGGLDKPHIAAYTNVTTASYGPLGFSGTSAATPHVAGTAALILSVNPNFSPAQLQTYLGTQAIDIEGSGFDYSTGWGRLHLNNQELPPCSPPSYISVPANDSDGFFQVSWGASTTDSAIYILEESTSSNFTSNLRLAYSGTGLTTTISNKTNGIYYYRVKATRDQYIDSQWITGSNGCVVSISSPDTTIWTGYNSSLWNNSGNWSSNAIPDNTTSVTIPSSPAGNYWPLISNTPANAKELFLSGQLTITYGSLIIGN